MRHRNLFHPCATSALLTRLQLIFDHRLRQLIVATATVAICATHAPAHAQSLDDVRRRGTLIVGTKFDFKPFGFRDIDGAIIGFEPDLARDIARRLQLRLQLEPVLTSNRIELLQAGRIDLLIATMNDRPERRAAAGVIDPPYYSSGVSIMAHDDVGLTDWEQLRGQTVCGIEGAWYNQTIASIYGARFLFFAAQSELEQALLARRCIGWVRDDIAFVGGTSDPKWLNFRRALPAILDVPMVMAVPLVQRDAEWGAFIKATIVDWHRSGFLLERERAWGIPASAFLRHMHNTYNPTTP